MIDFTLFRASMALLARDWTQTLRIFAFLGIVIFLVESVEYFVVTRSSSLLLTTLIWGIASIWMAVSWHRFILLSETTTRIIPKWNGKRMAFYFLNILFIYIIYAFVFLPSFLWIQVLDLGPLALSGVYAIVVPIASGLALYYVLRFGLILPAAAVGRKMRPLESWRKTRPYGPGIIGVITPSIVVLIVAFGLNEVLVVLDLPLASLGSVLITLITTLLWYFCALIELCALTQLYSLTEDTDL